MEDSTIIALFDQQEKMSVRREKALKEFILTTGSLNRAKMIIVMDPIADDVVHIKKELIEIKNEKKLQNGRIQTVECETRETRWLHRNPWAAGIALVVFLLGAAFIATKLDPNPTIEKIVPIVLKDE